MKIIITEKQYEKLSGEMEEALGVPEGILDAGEEIYDLIIQQLENFSGDIEELNNEEFEIDKEFTIGTHTFNKIKVKFDVEEHPQVKGVDMTGMSSENDAELTDTLVFQSVRDPKEVIVGFKFYIEPDTEVQDILNYIKKHRNEDIPSLSHELKHAYRDVKQKTEKLPDRASYLGVQEMKSLFGFINEVNEFFYNSYFIHAIENVVRPTELAAELKINNVSKKDFLNFFMNSEIIKRLKQIQNFSYENFKEKLNSKENIKKIKRLLKEIGHDIKGKSDEELIGMLLRTLLVTLSNKKNEFMSKFLVNSLFEEMFGIDGPKKEFANKYHIQTTKYGYDYDSFFKDEEKYFHKVSTQMIKKLAKLYAMTRNNPS